MNTKPQSYKNNFIKKACKKYSNYYLYNNVIYLNSRTKVNIICRKHGEFYIRPGDFLLGYGCPKCFKYDRKRKNEKDPLKILYELFIISEFD